ncbi:chromosome partitioning protein ParB [Photobacterium damselae subsp. piscicida]|nr:chromosome partitioning protein ParB [Photobacterium damselae subsp. piscicida]
MGCQLMAKKKAVMGLTDNQPGAYKSKQNLARANLESLPEQLRRDLEITGTGLHEYLVNTFGIETASNEVEWILESGKKETFVEVKLSYEQVKNETYVDFQVNGRYQDLLNQNNLSDLSTLDFQQFYPAIGCRVENIINILDGSRRRAYFLLKKGGIKYFTVLLAQGNISQSDAKALAKSLQSAKEHNLYEIGKRCELYKDAGLKSQEEIANALGISRTKVTRAMQAASIGRDLYHLFNDINDLTVKDYAVLTKVEKALSSRKDRTELLSTVESSPDSDIKEIIDALLHLIIPPKKSAPTISVTSLVEFDDKNRHARKKVKGRNVNYEFGRLSASELEHIDKAIQSALDELFSNK